MAIYDVEIKITQNIKGFCEVVRNDTMFAEHFAL